MKIGIADPEVLARNISGRIEKDLHHQRLAGAAVAVLQHGKLLYKEAFGVQTPGQPQRLREDAIFRIASMTKPVTAVAVLIQAQRGKLTLEDPIAEYLPEYIDLTIGPEGRPCPGSVRIWHLLTHTSGMEADDDTRRAVRSVPAAHNRTLAEAVAYYARLPLGFAPGVMRRYSGRATFDILARIVEITSGLDFAAFVQREIFDPCGMTDTTFAPNEAQWARMVGMHDYRDGCGMLSETTPGCVVDDIPVTHPLAGAGLVSTVDDYSRFAQMLLNAGLADGGRVLESSWLSRMHKPQLAPALMHENVNQGLGVRVITGEGYPWLPVGAYGWSGAYGTHFWVDPVNEITAIYMKNSRYDGGSGAITARHFEEDVFSAIF